MVIEVQCQEALAGGIAELGERYAAVEVGVGRSHWLWEVEQPEARGASVKFASAIVPETALSTPVVRSAAAMMTTAASAAAPLRRSSGRTSHLEMRTAGDFWCDYVLVVRNFVRIDLAVMIDVED